MRRNGAACPLALAYEQLRASVLESVSHGGHFGLVILLREGTAAWMDHASSRPITGGARTTTTTTHNTDQRTAPRLVLDGIHADMVAILALRRTDRDGAIIWQTDGRQARFGAAR